MAEAFRLCCRNSFASAEDNWKSLVLIRLLLILTSLRCFPAISFPLVSVTAANLLCLCQVQPDTFHQRSHTLPIFIVHRVRYDILTIWRNITYSDHMYSFYTKNKSN